jgi:hypothetical protein
LIEMIIAIVLTAGFLYQIMRAVTLSKWSILNQKLQHCKQAYTKSQQAYTTLELEKNNSLHQNTKFKS